MGFGIAFHSLPKPPIDDVVVMATMAAVLMMVEGDWC